MCNLHCITHFALVLHILHSFLSQSELSNFFVFIIRIVIIPLHFCVVHSPLTEVFLNAQAFRRATDVQASWH